MTTSTKLGIWMDHSIANLIEFQDAPMLTKTLECKFTHQEKEEAIKRGENTMHTKEQGEQAAYYKQLAEIIRNYEEVILFGPTDAKVELYHTFRDDHLFSKIKVEIRQADKMTENQQHAFVRKYFTEKTQAR
ncbi:hypothetical protein [Pedobacter sp. ASV28]|uniref:hypothetical protein n=1 Tax=Pedobacter sp. ASV28 TaxID=2795123 RepID=UPI0018ECE229|nr:hypothetical protein [Pedobacter sp. ASV28]